MRKKRKIRATPRQAPKKRRSYRGVGKAFLFFCKVLVIGAVLGSGGYAFANYLQKSDYFFVERIRIEGLHVLDPYWVGEYSGVTTATNILFLDEAAVEARITELPYVKTCDVVRVFPNLVVINIQEREALATLLVHNRPFAIDCDGVVVEELGLHEPHPGPFISEVPGLDVVTVGQQLDAEALLEAIETLRAFGETAVASEVTLSEIAARHKNDIRMYCDELPYEIRWGRGGLTEQARRLDFLWEYKNKDLECEEYCDLRFGRDVACR